ncbi:MAG: hypothetical protein A2784_03540 [Candidatus Chisholmbacteria bacterium RIFCSPHIGHO2_01_FULL_48_12]|uniref:Sugar 3,4-ketoisomerase QdtA cupin domain-containing protein n=1 Tax=Candidatus Chisholmbacteria bacterium RIFCSPHIGHO2_01_FULL_48_12 TaxID=1797589 RepID=A0A1G1VUU3_9BACT|nr:MAG: hypothetical protein A2784_03540 [Candidatus Chisholmbacteria bacterium RIFCSPHIGHO2_01_FULL_48_12]
MADQKDCKVVKTRDLGNEENGWLMEIGSSRDGWSKFLDHAQIYLTTLLPGKKKGWHLHHKKENQFTCIRGKVAVAIWDGNKIEEISLDAEKPITVRVPKEQAICFYNAGDEPAYILNLCSPPYDPEDPEQEDLNIPWEPSGLDAAS